MSGTQTAERHKREPTLKHAQFPLAGGRAGLRDLPAGGAVGRAPAAPPVAGHVTCGDADDVRLWVTTVDGCSR